jgi:hypothetical protein
MRRDLHIYWLKRHNTVYSVVKVLLIKMVLPLPAKAM